MSTGTTQRSVAYLGPRGSFAEAAVLAWPGSADAELLPSTSVPAALEAVRGDAVDHALVPIENSVEGSVSATLDELGSGQRLVIVDEVVLPVQFSLLVRPGTTLDQVSRIATHPHAQAQVRWWLAEHLPEASVIPAMSTAAAAAALLRMALGGVRSPRPPCPIILGSPGLYNIFSTIVRRVLALEAVDVAASALTTVDDDAPS